MAAGATNSAGIERVYFGVDWFTDGIDVGDAPDLVAGDSGWTMYGMLGFTSTGGASVNAPIEPFAGFVVDSKSMRKAHGNSKNLLLVAQLVNGRDTTLYGNLRVLLKLP